MGRKRCKMKKKEEHYEILVPTNTKSPYEEEIGTTEGGQTRHPIRIGVVVQFTEKYLQTHKEGGKIRLTLIVMGRSSHDGEFSYNVLICERNQIVGVGEFDIEPRPLEFPKGTHLPKFSKSIPKIKK